MLYAIVRDIDGENITTIALNSAVEKKYKIVVNFSKTHWHHAHDYKDVHTEHSKSKLSSPYWVEVGADAENTIRRDRGTGILAVFRDNTV